MFHSLKTLYETTAKHNKWLTGNFQQLEEYCLNDKEVIHKDGLNRGYNSLKWLIFTLRDELPQRELEDVFYFVLAECQGREELLYNGIKKTRTYFKYREYLKAE